MTKTQIETLKALLTEEGRSDADAGMAFDTFEMRDLVRGLCDDQRIDHPSHPDMMARFVGYYRTAHLSRCLTLACPRAEWA